MLSLKKVFKSFVLSILSLLIIISVSTSYSVAASTRGLNVYINRFWNGTDHFYSTSWSEGTNAGYTYEKFL